MVPRPLSASQSAGPSPAADSIGGLLGIGDVYSQMKAYVGFSAADEANLRALAEPLAPLLPEVVDKFYEVIQRNPAALKVFTGGEAQINRQRKRLLAWAAELFRGTYDSAYFEARGAIGRVHVDAQLPQHFMITAMEVIRSELEKRVHELRLPKAREKAASLNKLLALELGGMLEAYKKHYSARIRHDEREAFEEQLTRAEHMAQIGRLAASLAHAIKNPLAGVSGAIQVIRGTLAADSPHRAVIDEMLAQIDRLDATVRDLLVYSRPRAPALSSVDLNELIARVLNLLREEPSIRRLRVAHLRTNPLPRIQADERQLEQVVMNLLLNAADASTEGERITIITSFDGKVRMEIADRGVGMTPDMLEKVFEPFYTTKTRGTGLGLSITKQIVDAHDGRISLESQRHHGTTVTVELPVSARPPDPTGPNRKL